MTTLERFDPTGIQRVLCIVAHPDDMEYGGSAAVAEWTAQGIEVSYLLLTAGEAGMRGVAPKVAGPLRAAEQRAACDVVGVTDLTILDLPDGLVEHSIETRRRIAHAIRQARPDAIFTMTWDLEAGWGLNHADHRATGLAVVDAIRDADNPWLFREQLTDGLTEWKTTWLLATAHRPDHAIEVSERALELGIASLAAHREYLEALPDHPTPHDLVTGVLTGGGEQAGLPFALPVHAYRMG
ncbi:1D-myo-inositol 2-acetamido-2-deoxy-alpha-D-glucopyranoside deacetylase [Leucobacter aridicollis]|uniref:PIG-L deacetylase family protein n=1 Tax=Leucobacter aridicollis TaxID=283878 RepID=UPI0021680789|nr:PIG-L deacetylase family protein [Leucobacter aridicollis]MCS3428030.1 LmbE family N-acetylglucosaminyl deacetylase [Leucobacter aridicollis]